MNEQEAVNVLRIMASGIELKGYTDIWVQGFKEAYELAIKTLEEKPDRVWEDYSVDFYKCPECGYLLNKDCPQCGSKVILPTCNSKPHGKWIYNQYDANPNIGNWHCSECGVTVFMGKNAINNYCSNCGSQMSKGEEK